MFQFFYEEYRDTVFRNARQKFAWYFWTILFLPPGVGFGLTALFLWLDLPFWSYCPPLALCILWAFGITWYNRIADRKHREERKRRHEEYRVHALIGLLQRYHLCTKEGIDWLQECCAGRQADSTAIHVIQTIEKFFVNTVFPIVTLVLGIILGDMGKTEVLQYTLLVVLLTFFAYALFVTIKHSVAVFPEQMVLHHLKQDLGYLRTQALQ